MAKRSRAKGIYPAPVYEAHLSDGTMARLSFFSPKDKPIDFESGRRAADEILLSDIGRRLQTLTEAYKARTKVGGVYMEAPERVMVDPPVRWERAADGAWRGRWLRIPGLEIVRGFVEHPSFGTRPKTAGEIFQDLRAGRAGASLRAPVKIEHKPGLAAPVIEFAAEKRKRAARKAPAAVPNTELVEALRYVRELAEAISDTKPGANGRTRAALIVKACDDALAKASEQKEAA